jgi:hypothetical protein
MGLEGEMGDPRLHSQIDKNVQCMLSGGNARAMVTRAQTTTGTDNDKDKQW